MFSPVVTSAAAEATINVIIHFVLLLYSLGLCDLGTTTIELRIEVGGEILSSKLAFLGDDDDEAVGVA